MTYVTKAAFAWFMGFFPFFEIYAAVPASMALGLDHTSAALWAILGNYCPVLLIVFGYDRLMRLDKLQRWLNRMRSERFERYMSRYGAWFVLFVTPWIGVWVVAATAQLLGMKRTPLLLYSLISIGLYGLVIAMGVNEGLALFWNGG